MSAEHRNGGADRDLDRYRQAESALEATHEAIEELERTEAFDVFQKQLGLLRKRLLEQPELGPPDVRRRRHAGDRLGIQAGRARPRVHQDAVEAAARDDDMSAILLRFIWNLPLKFKRKFIVAIDGHLSDRYPMFKGLSQGWPGQNGIPPYIRSPEERARDFQLVNQGYLGYMNLGYSAREVDLFVWLEDAARQAVRGPRLRTRRAEAGARAEGRLPGQDPHPRDAAARRHRQVPRGAAS